MTESVNKNSPDDVTIKPDPWSLYWQADILDSCIPAAGTQDRQEIDALWQAIARSMPNARVLDLATGNGTVPVTLLKVASELSVTAVDKADIDPRKYLSEHDYLDGVQFKGGVDAAKLPFDDASFDLVTSQFGIEYAPRPNALNEACRVLAPEGRLVFLMHHVESEILSSATPLRQEIETLTQSNDQSAGLMSVLQDYLLATKTLDDLEKAGHDYLARSHVKTVRISGQVFEAINQLVSTPQFKVTDSEAPSTNSSGVGQAGGQRQLMFDNLMWRLKAEHQRLTELHQAALTPDDIDAMIKVLEQHQMVAIDAKRFVVGVNNNNPALVGWVLQATKT